MTAMDLLDLKPICDVSAALDAEKQHETARAAC
jgi:hypothetical protein